jgi:hypothetical protein
MSSLRDSIAFPADMINIYPLIVSRKRIWKVEALMDLIELFFPKSI